MRHLWHERPAYNSCRNRHCPKCQSLRQAQWIDQRLTRLLPTHYFHVVFTLPAMLRPLAHRNRRRIFTLLFQAAAQTLLTLGHDPARLGAQLGITSVLHTWTRELQFHPHVHCIVTGGGLSVDRQRSTRLADAAAAAHRCRSHSVPAMFGRPDDSTRPQPGP